MRDRLSRHEKVMGFGHAVYTTMDPRATVLKHCPRGRRAPRRHALGRHLRGDPGDRVRAEAALAERGPLRGRRVPRARHPHRPHDADLRDGPHGRLDRPRPGAVRRQQGDPSRPASTSGPSIRPGSRSRTAASASRSRGARESPAPSTTARTVASWPIPIRCTPLTPAISRMPCTTSIVRSRPTCSASSPAASSAWSMAGGTRTPGSLSFMNRAPFALRNGTMPISTGARSKTPRARTTSAQAASASDVVDDLGPDHVGAGVELLLQAAHGRRAPPAGGRRRRSGSAGGRRPRRRTS